MVAGNQSGEIRLLRQGFFPVGQENMELEEKQKALCLRILQTCRSELCQCFPYLDSAFAFLGFTFCTARGFRVDGVRISVHPRDLLERFSKEPEAIRRGYLHMLLHCLFLHLFHREGSEDRIWHLACDMAVEQMMELEGLARLQTVNSVRQDCLSRLGEKVLPAEQIAAILRQDSFPYSLKQLEAAFRFDDHSCWEEPSTRGCRSQWEQLLLNAAGKKAGQGRRGTTPGKSEESLTNADGEQYDYRAFLRRFTFPREEVELDTESFDYGFYHFGMEKYGSMPLIEPLEYREVRRLEELVIAIDTSGSCSAETVSRFLRETCGILTSQENFFRKMKVVFLQCDCLIQDATAVTSREAWLEYADNIRIQGRGGTDFTPVFEYVQKLRQQRELKELKALLYFTDGDGAYPSKPPDYETAFVLLKDTGHRELIPPWGRLLLI